MASIDDLVRPKADVDPETIAVLSAALEEAWDLLLQSGSNSPGLPMSVLCARSWRGASSIWRSGASGIEKELANGALRFLAANYRLERRRRQGSSGTAVAPAALPEITAAGSGHSPPLP